jgi:hypothetical protein
MNEFQGKCIDAVLALVENIIHDKIDFHEVRGEKENYFVGKVAHPPYAVNIYVYLDEAGFGVEGKDWVICERADNDSDADLIAALIKKLKAYFKVN